VRGLGPHMSSWIRGKNGCMFPFPEIALAKMSRPSLLAKETRPAGRGRGWWRGAARSASFGTCCDPTQTRRSRPLRSASTASVARGREPYLLVCRRRSTHTAFFAVALLLRLVSDPRRPAEDTGQGRKLKPASTEPRHYSTFQKITSWRSYTADRVPHRVPLGCQVLCRQRVELTLYPNCPQPRTEGVRGSPAGSSRSRTVGQKV
jgi:hypothetical protein